MLPQFPRSNKPFHYKISLVLSCTHISLFVLVYIKKCHCVHKIIYYGSMGSIKLPFCVHVSAYLVLLFTQKCIMGSVYPRVQASIYCGSYSSIFYLFLDVLRTLWHQLYLLHFLVTSEDGHTWVFDDYSQLRGKDFCGSQINIVLNQAQRLLSVTLVPLYVYYIFTIYSLYVHYLLTTIHHTFTIH